MEVQLEFMNRLEKETKKKSELSWSMWDVTTVQTRTAVKLMLRKW